MSNKNSNQPVDVLARCDAVGVQTAIELARIFSSEAGYSFDDLQRMDQQLELSMQGQGSPIVILKHGR